jgi:hypothetical protein
MKLRPALIELVVSDMARTLVFCALRVTGRRARRPGCAVSFAKDDLWSKRGITMMW